MTHNVIKLSSVAIVALTAASLMMTTSASAKRKRCVYYAWNVNNNQVMADGWAKAKKLSRACKRAKRRCNRELERKRRQGKAGRGSCVKVVNLSD